MKILCRILFLSIVLGGFLSAQIPIVNPGIPDYERISYTERVGNDTRVLEQKIRLLFAQGRAFYEFTSRSGDSESLIKMDKTSLFSFYSDITTRTADSVIRRTSEVLQSSIKPKADEFAVSDLGSLGVALRGFPWGKASYAKLVFLGSGGNSSGFNFELRVLGRETVKISGKSWDCWKMEMGLGGIFGGFFGKSYFWFNSLSPYFLVRSEGLQGPPGTPIRILEIKEYSVVE